MPTRAMRLAHAQDDQNLGPTTGGLGSALAAKAPPDRSSSERRDGFTHISPARSIFSNAVNFCRSAIAVLVRSP
jgi:hypothetical protein